MREIKFRGKRIRDDKWVYGSLIGDTFITEDRFGKPLAEHGPKDIREFEIHPIMPPSVGQFTGLKDKNGKEIYEGDVVQDYEGVVHYVRWSVGDGCFDFTGSPYALSDDCEVIGNIHDNPELLK